MDECALASAWIPAYIDTGRPIFLITFLSRYQTFIKRTYLG